MSTRTALWILIVIIVVVGAWYAFSQGYFGGSSMMATSTAQTQNTVMYSCAGSQSITAQYGTSQVMLSLSDGRSLTLPQTMSGSGIRYEEGASTSDDVVFWSEGNDAYMTENGSTTYQDCVGGTVAQGSGTNSFTDQSNTFTFQYPSDWSVQGGGGGYTQSWMENATTSGMILAEIDVPQSDQPNTNFVEAKFTVGTSADPSAIAECSVNPFGSQGSTTQVTVNGVEYTKVTYTDVGAGQYYDTTSYRTVRNSQCYAIEYTIHYGNFQNYPAGSVQQFNEAQLTNTFEGVVQSFTWLQ